MEPRNPVEIERELREVANQIARGVQPRSEAFKRFSDAERALKIATAKAFINAPGAQKFREMMAIAETAEERERRDIAEQAFKHTEYTMQALRDRLSALQSEQKSVVAMFEPIAKGR